MKKIIAFVLLSVALSSTAQSVGIGTSTPNASSKLEISSTNSGLLIPRMTTIQRSAIVSPATGLLVYDSDSASFTYYTGTIWIYLKGVANIANNWSTVGNINTGAGNFIGTTDNKPLRIRVNNRPAGKIDPSGKSIGWGDSALYFNTGYSNVAVGAGALLKNNDKNNLVAIGDSALYYNGTDSLFVNDASFNTAVGSKALYANTTGADNTANGSLALQFNTIGFNNSALGSGALHYNTEGVHNTAMGTFALYNNLTGIRNSSFGSGALYYNTGSDNCAMGSGTLYNNTTGATNTAMGSGALTSNSTGYDNAAIGALALYWNTIGYLNSATGSSALISNTSGSYNTANGAKAAFSNTTGGNNSAIGNFALYTNSTGSNNTALGISALYYNINGNFNTATGSTALYSNNFGIYNTANGAQSLFANIFGSYNVAVGYSALENNIDGNYNTAVGWGAGTSSGSFHNTVSIGNNGWLNGATNQAFIGNASTAWIGGWVGWSIYSDARIKTKITEEVKGLDFITRLRPVTYYRSINAANEISGNKMSAEYPEKYAAENIQYSGFLAQEVEQAAQQAGYNFSGISKPKTKNDLYSLSYESFVVPLVKAVQEQQSIIEALKKQLALLETRLTAMEKK